MPPRTTSPQRIQNKRIVVQKSDLKGLLSYGANNNYPQDLELLLSDSVTGSACRSVKAEFIEGNGFLDGDISRLIVHRSGLTMDTVLNTVADNVSFLEAAAFQIGYNALGQMCSIKPIVSKKIRLAEPNDEGILTHGAICPFLGSTYNQKKRKEFTLLPLFNPDPAVVLEQIGQAGGIDNYYGQLLYVQFGPPGDDYYLQPSWVAGGKSVESEGWLDTYYSRIISSGFNISGIYKVMNPGPVEGVAYDPMRDEFSIENQLSDHQGSDNAGSILIQRFDSKEEMEMAQFIDTTGANLADRYKATSERVETQITRAWRVPNELVNIRRSGGIAPTGDEIKISSQLMQQTVNRTQRRISQLFEMLFRYWKTPIITKPEMGWQIENLNYFPDADKGAVAQAG